MELNDPTHGFCRDCLTLQTAKRSRCLECGSPRVIRHRDLYQLTLAHIDCDAFFASVEKRDRPELIHQPVIIGGGKRGVVATACYIARVHGVRSAMPMFQALKACPKAVVIKPDMQKYRDIGMNVRNRMLALTPMIEPISIDEAFLDLSGTEKLHDAPPALVLARLAREIEIDLNITVSIGLSYCKFLAKVASDLDKPRGFSVLGEHEALSFLQDKPVTMIWGVGKSFAKKLKLDGIQTIGQLQNMDRIELVKRYQSMGERLYFLSRGQDSRQITTQQPAKSISAETTFNDDIGNLDGLTSTLRALSEKVSLRLKTDNLAGQCVVLKIKSSDFISKTRNQKLTNPTQLADKIFTTGLALLKPEIGKTRYRLLGIGVSDLVDGIDADPQDLADPDAQRRARAETAMDSLRHKFGGNIIETGYTFSREPHRKQRKNDID